MESGRGSIVEAIGGRTISRLCSGPHGRWVWLWLLLLVRVHGRRYGSVHVLVMRQVVMLLHARRHSAGQQARARLAIRRQMVHLVLSGHVKHARLLVVVLLLLLLMSGSILLLLLLLHVLLGGVDAVGGRIHSEQRRALASGELGRHAVRGAIHLMLLLRLFGAHYLVRRAIEQR